MENLERILGITGARATQAVQIGGIWRDLADVDKALHPYCKHIFANNEDAEYPHSFPGSGTAIRIANRHFLFCCNHQIKHWEPHQIAFRPANANVTVSPSHVLAPKITDDNSDTDLIDARALEYEIEKYSYVNLTSEFFAIDGEQIWPDGATQAPFMVYGYPTALQNIDYSSPKISARSIKISARYAGETSSPHLHTLEIDREQKFSTDGMSGGPVFYIGRRNGSNFVGWAGMVVMGGANSEFLHFLTAQFLIEMVFHFPVETICERLSHCEE